MFVWYSRVIAIGPFVCGHTAWTLTVTMDTDTGRTSNTAIIRRSQARASLRENRPQPVTRRRARSRSPESRPASVNSMNQQPSTSNNSVALRKRKKPLQSSLTAPTISSANHSRHTQHSQDEDHLQTPLRKGKSKAKLSGTRSNIGDLLDRGRLVSDLPRSWKRNPSPDAIEADDESTGAYSGPLAVAEFNRLKLEVEKLREVRALFSILD